MDEKVEILTRVYAYINKMKVYLALKDIAGVWHVINELNNYLISIDCSTPTIFTLGSGEIYE